MTTKSLTFEQFVVSSPKQTYKAFTNATSLREWLCDVSTVKPKPGGRIYLAWNSGFYAAGEYTHLESDRSIAFTWQGRDEPGVSQVHVNLEPRTDGTMVHLEHILPKQGEEWAMTIQEIEEGWRGSLENLASTQGTGEDLRFIRRPMLGIKLSDFNAEIAEKLGVPFPEGIRIDGVVEGMGAQEAGLQADDVIIKFDGYDIHGFLDLPVALQRHQADDIIEVAFYRGGQLKSVQMKLSRRPIPVIPATCAELANRLKQPTGEIEAELENFLKNVTERQADFRPGLTEWNIKEILAHLIQNERYTQFNIMELASGYESWTDDWGGNSDAQVKATVCVYRTIPELLNEYKHSTQETIALITSLPEEFCQNKASYWRMAYNILEWPQHFYSHLEQMRKTLSAASSE